MTVPFAGAIFRVEELKREVVVEVPQDEAVI